MNDDNNRIIVGIFVILINLAYFCLGISEAIFVSRYSEFDDQCRQIWSWILAACVFDITIPVISFCGIRNLLRDRDEPNDEYDIILYVSRLGFCVIAIWSAVTYYNIDSSCHYFWTSQSPQLWTFVMIHFVALWIIVGFLCFIALLVACMCCTACFAPKEKKSVLRQKSQLFNTISHKLDRESV